MEYGKLLKVTSYEKEREEKYFKNILTDLNLGWEGQKIKIALIDIREEVGLILFQDIFKKYLDNTCVVKKINSSDLIESTLLQRLYESFVGRQFFDLIFIKASWLTINPERRSDLFFRAYGILEKGGILIFQNDLDDEDKVTIKDSIKKYFKSKNLSIKFIRSKNKETLIIMKADNLSLKNFAIVSIAIYPVWILWYIFGIDKLHLIMNNQTIDVLLTIFIFSIINWIFGNRRVRWIISLLLNMLSFGLLVNLGSAGGSETVFAFSETLIVYPLMFLVVTFLQFMTWIPFLIKFYYQNRKNLHNIRWE